VNESGGARTPLSGFIGSLLMLLIVLFLSGVLRYLPQPVLAAIVLMAVMGLFNVRALKHFWRADRTEFVVAVAALLGVLGSGLLRGVLIGAIISLVQLLRRASRPRVAFLGRIPGTRRFSDMARHPDNESIPGALLVRVESSLLYFNAEHVRDVITARLRTDATPPKIVVLDLSASPFMDIQACGVVMNMADDIKSTGARLQIVEARSSVRDRLRAEGIEEHISDVNRFTSVADAVEDFHKSSDQTTNN
jgi:anti-anti-sigma factor